MQILEHGGAAGPSPEVPSWATHEQVRLQLDVCLAEYDRLKSEQAQRIVLRDNLVYATLVATAGVVAFAFNKEGDVKGLLVLPFACFVLGWLHTINDEKSAAIGRYLRTAFRTHIIELTGDCHPCIFGWENAVRSAKYRACRKVVQLISNLLTFVAPGAAALLIYRYIEGTRSWPIVTASALGGFLLVVLACAIILEADIGFIDRAQKLFRTWRRQAPQPQRQARRSSSL